ncbi:hypothetical protein FKM82_020212, partial [Ascaphus truei]
LKKNARRFSTRRKGAVSKSVAGCDAITQPPPPRLGVFGGGRHFATPIPRCGDPQYLSVIGSSIPDSDLGRPVRERDTQLGCHRWYHTHDLS